MQEIVDVYLYNKKGSDFKTIDHFLNQKGMPTKSIWNSFIRYDDHLTYAITECATLNLDAFDITGNVVTKRQFDQKWVLPTQSENHNARSGLG